MLVIRLSLSQTGRALAQTDRNLQSELSDEALEQLLRTVELDPNFPVTYWILGLLYRTTGGYAIGGGRLSQLTDIICFSTQFHLYDQCVSQAAGKTSSFSETHG